jgi:hypothetical protein
VRASCSVIPLRLIKIPDGPIDDTAEFQGDPERRSL